MKISSGVFSFLIIFGIASSAQSTNRLIPDPPILTPVLTLNVQDQFQHQVGRRGSVGWELDYKKHKTGFALNGMEDPLLLEPGTYRMTFSLRRGKYPKKGFLHKAYALFRIELWDVTFNQLIHQRELQIADFEKANVYEPRWIEFSMKGREGHLIEPRVYWNGLSNGEVGSIKIERFKDPDLAELEEKAFYIGKRLQDFHLENGFVVSRKKDGKPDEIGDATTYTGFYIASLAWKFAVTQDRLTYQALENGLNTLHKSIKGTADAPYLTRFVDAQGVPHPDTPSKDVYTSYFLAMSAAHPYIENDALKEQMTNDMIMLGDRFLEDGLTVKKGDKTVMSLTPYYTEAEIQSGIQKLFTKNRDKKLLKNLKIAKKAFPFSELWPGMNKVIKAIKKKDQEKLFALVVPTLNGLSGLVERARDILREQYRNDLFPRRKRKEDYPGKRLEELLSESLAKLPPKEKDRILPTFKRKGRFERTSDLKILGSNALITLHIIKTAAALTNKPQFIEYYRTNLYQQDALLKTALDWYSLEEDFVRLVAGNPSADRLRKGYLSTLALYNLIQLETNESIRERYQSILSRWWDTYRNEDNPMAHALVRASLKDGDVGVLLKELDQYSIDQSGFGGVYWKKNGDLIAEKLGGGKRKKYSREPLPISHRPRDSFLWQRNARRLKGDHLKDYPGTDYLFVYWFSRYHNLIPSPTKKPVADITPSSLQDEPLR